MSKPELGTNFSIEEQFIVDCLRFELFPNSDFPIINKALDWEKVFTILEHNKLATHFYILSSKLPGLFPDFILERLKYAYLAILLYGDHCKLDVNEILSALNEASIPVIVLKGWVVIQWLYQRDHGQRYCEDIDILVPHAFIPQAEVVLKKSGYEAVRAIDPEYAFKFTNAQAYQKVTRSDIKGARFQIGLHWGLTHYPFYDKKRIEISDLFDRAIPLQVAGVGVFELSLEDQLIYTCAHLALHHRNEETLLQYFEIAAILMRMGDTVDWEVVISRAVSWGYIMQIRYVIGLILSLWPQVVPEELLIKLNAVKTKWQERWTDHLVRSTKGNRYKSTFVEVIALPGLGNKFKVAINQIFPSRDYMKWRYGESGEELPRAYWFRIREAIIGFFTTRPKVESPKKT